MPARVPSLRNQEIVNLRHDGHTISSIATSYQISQQRVSQIIQHYGDSSSFEQYKAAASSLKSESLKRRCRPYVEPVITLMRQGLKRDAIVHQLAIKTSDWPHILGMIDAREQHAWRTHLMRQASNKKTYSDEDIFHALKEAAVINGGKIGTKSYANLRTSHPEWPSVAAISVRGWNTMVAAAGLPVSRRPHGMGLPRFSDADMRRSLIDVMSRLGHPPGMHSYDQMRMPGSPTSNALKARFAGWNAALVALLPDPRTDYPPV